MDKSQKHCEWEKQDMQNDAPHDKIYGSPKSIKQCMYLLHVYTHIIKHKYIYDSDIYQFLDFVYFWEEERNGEEDFKIFL